MVEDRDTILELSRRMQELQNEINWMNGSRDFQDAESVRSGQCHIISQPTIFPLHPDYGGMLSCPLNPWCSNLSEHTSPHVMSENRTRVQDQKFQSGPSARNSVVPCVGRFFTESWDRPTTTADFGSPL